MAITIEFLGPINKKPISVDIQNLNELSEILKQDENLKSWLNNSAVAVNDTLVKDKNKILKDGDKVSLLPPVCGG
jgi:molybdopterin synthase sulfur carrier subunit